MTDPSVTVRDNPDESRYEAFVDGEQSPAGYSTYERHDGLIAFLHTEVGEEYAGQGIGNVLVQQSLHDVRTKELTVRPVCPFYKKFFDEHPGYTDLLGA